LNGGMSNFQNLGGKPEFARKGVRKIKGRALEDHVTFGSEVRES